MNLMPTPRMKRRLNIWVVLFMIIFTIVIFTSMVSSAVTNSARYQALANSNQFGSTPIHAARGTIYDKNGNVLAQSATVFNIILSPKNFQMGDTAKADILADKLVELFKIDRASFIEKTKITGSGSGYQVIKKKVEKPLADELTKFCEENGISKRAIYPEADTKRYYSYGDLGASVIGFLDGDGQGQYGLEAQYDQYLSGTDGRTVTAKDAHGDEMPYRYEKTFDAQNGNSLILTLDTTLQFYLEKELKSAVSVHDAKNRACGIIMNAKTGEILAMASEPGFDLNEPATIYNPKTQEVLSAMPKTTEEEKKLYSEAYAVAREKQWKNKAITELYEPGSVFKVVTGSAALEEKVIDLNTSFTCNTMTIGPERFHCWTKIGHGQQNFVQAITSSCNPAFIQIGQKLGDKKFSEYFSAYGLTAKTGIDLPGEASSLYVRPENMGMVELASCSFGQSNKITPIQMITAYAATINGGNLVTPYIVSKIEDYNGNVIKAIEPNIRRQVISEETSAIMRSTLESVVNVNGGGNSYIKGYKIGGKSGTSQKLDENIKQERDDLYVSSYVGFAPADDPEIIMLVMVDEPSKGEYYGSVVAVPVVTNVFTVALPYLGYYPEYTKEELDDMDIPVQSVEGMGSAEAVTKLADIGLNGKVVGNGTTVIAQVPAKGNFVPRNGTIMLYTEENYKEEFVNVPNLVGLTVVDANKILTNLGLNIKATGATKRVGATVSMQNWQEGAVVAKGTIIELIFAIHDQTG